MQLQFEKNSRSCLRKVLEEVQNMEQTHEIRIPEGMPGIDRVISAWGQTVMRSKDWHGRSISLSAGMLVWILYISGENGALHQVESWIPFQLHWDLPEDCPEGTVRMLCIPRYVDARSVSAGRIMVRAGVAALAEAWCPEQIDVYTPKDVPDSVELLQSKYPVRLPKETGERQFSVEETLALPGSAPVPRRLICYRVDPAVTDKKVLSNKIVFRGNGNLHVLYESDAGQVHTWDFELPWSQFADLSETHSQDAQVDVRLMPTAVELEKDADGKLHLDCTFAAQYLVDDREILELTEDAYSPGRELSYRQQMLELPAILDDRRENIYGEQTLQGQADLITDAVLLPDFPRQRSSENGVALEMPGLLQLLYYGQDGTLQSSVSRWQGNLDVPMDPDSRISVLPVPGQEIQADPGADTISVRTAVPVQMRFSAGQGMPMVTQMELGEKQQDPDRPSLVIRRMDTERLWDLAKTSGSTVASIQQANGLAEEPAPGQMLLIPVK